MFEDTVIHTRTLHFPVDHSCGRLYQQRVEWDELPWQANMWTPERRVLADARGAVRVPADQERSIRLKVNAQGAADLSFLTPLDPDGIGTLDLHGIVIGAAQMHFLAHLTGLRRLDLRQCTITPEALALLPRLRQLRRLVLGPLVDPADKENIVGEAP